MAVWRWVLTLPFAVFLVLGILDVRNPDAAVLAFLVGVLLLLGQKPVRAAAAELVQSSAGVRAADLVLWNAFLAFVLAEMFLNVYAYLRPSPLLLVPNARSQERIQSYKDSLPSEMEGDPRNSQGFNDTEWDIPKPEGTFRVIALGDSFAFGVVGYQDNFLTLLEHRLDEQVDGPVEVCNLGIPALDPIDYLEMLTLEGKALEPDLVLVCLFAGNDFVRTARGSLLRLRNFRVFAVPWRLWRVQRETSRQTTKEGDGPTPGEFVQPPAFSDEAYLEIAGRYLEFLRRQYPPETEQKVQDTLDVLDKIAGSTGDGRLVVALLPCEVQVNPRLRGEVCRAYEVREDELDLDHPARRVRAHFQAREVRVVDLLPSFLAAESEGETYRRNDSHWNVRGNRVAAEVLAEALRERIRGLR